MQQVEDLGESRDTLRRDGLRGDPIPTSGGGMPRRRFIVGHWLARALSVCVTSFPHLLVATLIAMVPTFAIEWSMTRGPSTRADRAFSPILVRVFFQSIEAGVGFVVQGIVVMLVFQKLRKKRLNPFHSIRVGLSRPPVLIGIIVCFVLAVAACLIPVGILTAAVPWLLLLIAFAAIPYVIWFVASTAAVVERISLVRSLARSAELTKGQRLRVFAAFAILLLLAAAISEVLAQAFNLFVTAPPATASDPEEPFLHLVVRGVAAVLGGIMGSVLPVVIYHDLRESKEGIGLEQLASSFDAAPAVRSPARPLGDGPSGRTRPRRPARR